MDKKEIINNYLPIFEKIEYDEYDEKNLRDMNDYHDLGTVNGLEWMYVKIKEEVPDFSNREEVTNDIFKRFLDLYVEHKDRVYIEADFAMSLMRSNLINRLQREYQIKQIIPDLKDIIRKMIKEEFEDNSASTSTDQ